MNDLNTINRLNAATWQPVIDAALARGCYVLVTYEGLHILDVASYVDRADALAAAVAQTDLGRTVKLKAPLSAPAPALDINEEQDRLLTSREALLKTKPTALQHKTAVLVYLMTASQSLADIFGPNQAFHDVREVIASIIHLSGSTREQLKEWADAQAFVDHLVDDFEAMRA